MAFGQNNKPAAEAPPSLPAGVHGSPRDTVPDLGKDAELKAYRDMLLIRRFEEKAGQMYG
jgi:pyruvate dehydrogenase E1 component alpha subunit